MARYYEIAHIVNDARVPYVNVWAGQSDRPISDAAMKFLRDASALHHIIVYDIGSRGISVAYTKRVSQVHNSTAAHKSLTAVLTGGAPRTHNTARFIDMGAADDWGIRDLDYVLHKMNCAARSRRLPCVLERAPRFAKRQPQPPTTPQPDPEQ